MPHELALVGIYFSPLLPIVLFGILGALAPAIFLRSVKSLLPSLREVDNDE